MRPTHQKSINRSRNNELVPIGMTGMTGMTLFSGTLRGKVVCYGVLYENEVILVIPVTAVGHK